MPYPQFGVGDEYVAFLSFKIETKLITTRFAERN